MGVRAVPSLCPERQLHKEALQLLRPVLSSLRVLSMQVGTPECFGVGSIHVNPWLDISSFPSLPWSAADAQLLTSHGVPLSVATALEGQLEYRLQHMLISMLLALLQEDAAACDQLNAHQKVPLCLGSAPRKDGVSLVQTVNRVCKARYAERGHQVACKDWTQFGSTCEVWLHHGLETTRVLVQSEPNSRAAVFDFSGVHLTGGRVWAGALILSRWLASLHFASGSTLADGRHISLGSGPVLELGAGLGLSGLLLARLGRKVILSDREPVLLGRLEENIALNGVQDNCRALRLDWAEAGDTKMRRLLKAQAFSAVIGSDVIYNEEKAQLLLQLLPSAMPGGGVAYLVNAGKHREGLTGFAEKLRGAGHDVYESVLPREQSLQDLVCGDFEPEQEYVALAVVIQPEHIGKSA
eukprot:TRINITY_DN16678_c0_g1_i1.p1 TRINITY_DN16678_c0_g1~~TRINITY_DN16678_c0_g1_i1.p1  ORF type:complete len:411 (-),score=57.28 TRINITY_DN16678_c0_g1_i1:685-1917(-)